MKAITIVVFFTLALVSCQKLSDPVITGNEELIGSWTDPQYSDTLITYSRTENLVENQFGITFKPENTLVERQNSGFCGTPPITTADYEGTWIQKDSIVNISVGFWGGKAEYTWRIVSLNNQKLVISIVKADYSWGK